MYGRNERGAAAAVLLLFFLSPPPPAAAAAAKRVAAADDDRDDSNAFGEAFEDTFALLSGAEGAANHPAALRAVTDLLVRHGVPLEAARLRSTNDTSDAQLLRIALLAGVGCVSRWRRTPEGRLLLDEGGSLLHPYSPSAVESDVMLCIVCTLLAVVVMFHIVLPPPPPPPAAAAAVPRLRG